MGSIEVNRDVTWHELTRWATKHAVIESLETQAQSGVPQNKTLAKSALLILNTGKDLHSTHADTQNFIAQLNTIVSAEALAELTSLTKTQSPILGLLRKPHAGEVSKARGLA
jgi:hypothetical protein